MKRPRSDSKLEALTDDQKAQLCEWLLTPGLNYLAIMKLMAEEFHVTTSMEPLSRFYHTYCESEVLRRRAQAVSARGKLGQEITSTPGEWNAVTIDALKQKVFELAICPTSEASEVIHLFSLILKLQTQDSKWRKVRAPEAAEDKGKEDRAAKK